MCNVFGRMPEYIASKIITVLVIVNCTDISVLCPMFLIYLKLERQ